METKTKTEFTVMGLNSDGTSRVFQKTFKNAEAAQQHIEEYKSYTERFTKDFKPFDEYKVVKRNVITTWEEWGDA